MIKDDKFIDMLWIAIHEEKMGEISWMILLRSLFEHEGIQLRISPSRLTARLVSGIQDNFFHAALLRGKNTTIFCEGVLHPSLRNLLPPEMQLSDPSFPLEEIALLSKNRESHIA